VKTAARILGLAGLGLALTSLSGHGGGIAAASAGEQTPDVPALTKAANGGDIPSMRNLAIIYAQGDGVPKDETLSRQWAKAAADLNDPMGEWLYYLTVAGGSELNYAVKGTPNIDLYNKLGKRSIAERALDISAYSALAKALAAGLPQARHSVVGELLDHAAPGNREAALALIQNPTPLADSDSMVQTLTQQKQLGETLTKPSMFSDVLQSAGTAAMAAAKGSADTPEKLVKTVISKPLSQDTYLPVPEAPFQHFYLLQGTWQETWTFDVGGTQVSVPIDFQADGLGGAYYEAKATIP
jgi:hypothetical protein